MDLVQLVSQWLQEVEHIKSKDWNTLWHLHLQAVSLRDEISKKIIYGEHDVKTHQLHQVLLQGEQKLRAYFLTLEITSINQHYLEQNELKVEVMGRGYAWLDTGTHECLLEAGQFIQTIENRQSLKVACLEEIAFEMGYIDADQLRKLAEPLSKNQYGQYLLARADQGRVYDAIHET